MADKGVCNDGSIKDVHIKNKTPGMGLQSLQSANLQIL